MDRIEYLKREIADEESILKNCEDLERFYAQLCNIATEEPILKAHEEREKLYAELSANHHRRLANLRAALGLETQKLANPAT
jgi:hypothetical protein